MKPTARLRSFLFATSSALLALSSLPAASIYWDGGTSTWTTLSAWSTASGAATPDPTTVPGSADDLFFNRTNNNTAANVVSFSNGDRAAKSLTFTTSGTSNLRAGAADTAAANLTIGTGGITLASTSGSVTIGQTPSLYGTITTVLAAAQSWTNNSSSTLTVAGPVTNGGFLLTLAGAGNTTINGAIGGTGGLTKNGDGTLTLTGASNYGGTTTVNGGTLNLGGGTATGSLTSATLTLAGGSLSYTRTGTNTQNFTTTNIGGNSVITGASGNTLNLGTVARTGGNRFYDFGSTGLALVSASAASNTGGIMAGFTVGNSWAVANDAGVAISGLADGSYTLSSGAGTSGGSYTGNVDVNSSEGTLDAGITANSLRFSGNAANTLSLTGANTVTTGGILVGSGVGGFLSTISGGTLTGAASKDLVIIQNNTLGGLTISSDIVNNTSTSLTKSGAGLLTLSGNNTFTGGVVIHAGRLALGNAGALNSTTPNNVTFGAGSTGTLSLGGNSVTIPVLNTNATSAGSTIIENASATNATLTINSSSNSTFAGIIQNGTGDGTLALSKSGSGTLTLSGANTYTGGTTLTAGTVAISHATALGSGAISVTGNSRINAAALTYANDINIDATRVLTIGTTGAGNSTSTFSGAITGDGGITLAQGVSSGTIVNLSSTSNTFKGNITLPTATGTNDFINFASIGDGGSIIFGRPSWRSVATYTGSANLEFNTRTISLATTSGGTTGLDGGGNPINMFANNGAGTVTINTAMGMTTTSSSGIFWLGGTNTGSNTFAGAIADPTGANTLGIGKYDAGKWILSNNTNSFEGNVLLAAGTLSVGVIDVAANAQPLGKGSFIQLGYRNADTGTLEYTGSTNATTDKQIQLGQLSNSANSNFAGGGVILNNGDGTLTFSNSTFNSTAGVPVTGTGVNRTLTLGGTNTGANTISGTIQDNNTTIGARLLLTKTGAGTWVLAGNNSYSGGTSVNAGTLQVNAGSSLGVTTAALSLGSGTATALGAIGNLTLNENVTAGAFTVKSNTATTTGADVGLLTIAAGKTLTTGAMTVGLAAGTTAGQNTKTALSTAGGGSLIVNGQLNMSQAGDSTAGTSVSSILDLSGLANFTNNNPAGNTVIGASPGGLVNSYGILTLANTSNLINATSFLIGNSGSSNSSQDDSVVNLGAGTNTIQASTIAIGTGKAQGTLQFAGSTGSVNISGTNGSGTAAITLGNATAGTYLPGTRTNNLLLAGHNATVDAGAVIAGQNAGNTGGAPTSFITFDTGTFNATSVTLASSTSGSSSGSPTATFTIGGPTANSAATGVLTVTGNFLLANNVNSTAGATGTATGSLIINGGTVNIGSGATNGIYDATTSTTGSSATTLTLAGGTLNLNGCAIGGTANAGKKNITNLNFESGTLKNVSQINDGAGLTKTTGGILILDGTNTYTGATTVNGGTLSLSSSGSIDNTSGVVLGGGTFDVSAKSGSYSVANLSGNGTVVGSLTVSTQLAIGTSPGTVNFDSLTLGASSTYLYELTGGSNTADLGNVAATLSLGGATLDLAQLGTYTVNEKFTLFAYTTGNLTGTFSGLADGSQFTDAGGDWIINYDDNSAGLNGGTGTSFVTITAVPEPRAALLGALGLLALLRRRR